VTGFGLLALGFWPEVWSLESGAMPFLTAADINKTYQVSSFLGGAAFVSSCSVRLGKITKRNTKVRSSKGGTRQDAKKNISFFVPWVVLPSCLRGKKLKMFAIENQRSVFSIRLSGTSHINTTAT
jgi:hypothetical protein